MNRRSVSFLKLLPITLMIGMASWAIVRPVYDSAVAGLAQVFIRSFEYPKVTRLEVQDHHARVFRSDFRSNSKILSIPLTEVHFNLIVLLALYLALPRPWSKEHLEKLFMGVSILYLSQTINLLLHVKCLYAIGLGDWSLQNYSDFSRNFYGFWRYFTDLPGRFSFPFVIWLGFNWEEVIGLLSISQQEPKSEKKTRSKRQGGRSRREKT